MYPTIVILDDEPVLRKLMIKILELTFPSSRLCGVSSSEEVFNFLKNHKPDLITTDINHIGENGFTLIQTLKSTQEYKSIPVIAITGSNQSESGELNLYRSGFKFILYKPFQIKNYIKIISSVLDETKNPDFILLELATERPDLDYKEKLTISTKDERAEIAKDVISMANWGGGIIIVGVKEIKNGNFEKVGLDAVDQSNFEVTIINKAIHPFLDPTFHIGVRKVEYENKVFGFLEIPSLEKTVVLAKRKNEKAKLFPGRVYCRSDAAESSEIQNSKDLRNLIDRIIKNITKGLT